MNWIANVVPPKIKDFFSRRETPENLWIKCPETGQMVFHKDLEQNSFVIPGSNYHMRMTATQRLASIFDDGRWEDIAVPDVVARSAASSATRSATPIACGMPAPRPACRTPSSSAMATIEGVPVVVAVQDFDFMGGSLGMAAGEAVVKGLLTAAERGTPFIMFAASGGARMQEGILSLMQMPRTTVAIQRLREARKPYIVVLTNPTTGGVTASYAMLGDVQIAEPGALIGFAGPRVIEQTIREKLPEGFQRSEYLKEHGMVDMVVHRHELKPTLAAVPPPHQDAGRARKRRRRPDRPPDRRRPAHMTTGSDAIIARFMALHPKKIDLSLGRIEALLARLGHPERRLPPVIHVAGTNGKGSTIAFLRAALEAAGHGVHVYTSPHLVHFHERIRLAGPAAAASSTRRASSRPSRPASAANAGDPITVFEITTAAAFLLFAENPADVAPARGRARRPARRHQRHRRRRSSTVITSISLDHADFLGTGSEAIAAREGRHPQARRARRPVHPSRPGPRRRRGGRARAPARR